jgi:hypothetical protein
LEPNTFTKLKVKYEFNPLAAKLRDELQGFFSSVVMESIAARRLAWPLRKDDMHKSMAF